MAKDKSDLHIPPAHGFMYKSNSDSAFSDAKFVRNRLNKLLREYHGLVAADVVQMIRNTALLNPTNVSRQISIEYHRSLQSYLELIVEDSNNAQYEPPRIVCEGGEYKVLIARYAVEPPAIVDDFEYDSGPDKESGDYEGDIQFKYK